MNHYIANNLSAQRSSANKLSCQTPGCESVCPSAFSCHERRQGAGGMSLSPVFALLLFVAIGVTISGLF